MVEVEWLYKESKKRGGGLGKYPWINSWLVINVGCCCYFYPIHEANYTDMPSPGAFLSTPGDRQHVDKQAFPWDSFQSTPGDSLHRGQTSLPPVPIWVCQEIDYRKTNESSPGAPYGGPGDRLHKDRQVFPGAPLRAPGDRLHIEDKPSTGTLLRVHRRTDYIYKSSLEPLSEYPRGQTTKT